jgi:hypothetical protein
MAGILFLRDKLLNMADERELLAGGGGRGGRIQVQGDTVLVGDVEVNFDDSADGLLDLARNAGR